MTNKGIDYPLSDDDIERLLDDEVKIIPYSSIKKYKNIDELLYPFDKVVILFKTSNTFGHWCCIFRDIFRNEIEFFDPYGLMIDDQLEYNDDKVFQKQNGQDHFYLTRLLADTNSKKISYNHHKFQKFDPNIATCGRWCVHRLLNSDLSLEEYKKKLDKNRKNMTYDKYITKIIKI